MRPLVVVAVALSVAAGCRGCDELGGGEDAPPELRPALGALCDLAERCPDLLPLASRSPGECMDVLYWLLTCRLVEDEHDELGLERRELHMDAATAEACARFLDGLGCDDLACVDDGSCPEAEACFGLFAAFGGEDEDRPGLGEECWGGAGSCAPGLHCGEETYDEVDHVVVCRLCVPPLERDEECRPYGDGVPCGPGLGCLQDPETGSGSCAPLRADGEPCGRETDCQSGFCALSSGLCSSGGRQGEPCEGRGDCRAELTCVGGACGPLRQNGEPCAQDDHCVVYRCETDGLCGLAEGASCHPSSDHDCRSGYCEDATRRCARPLADGSPCSAAVPEACRSGHCDEASSECAPAPPPQPLGGPCERAEQCEEGLECQGVCYRPCSEGCPEGERCDHDGYPAQCRPLGEDGASCWDDEACLSGFCNDAERCATRPGIGDPCSGWSDCYPRGTCSGGLCVRRREPGESCESFDSCLQPFLCLEGRCQLISLSCEPAPPGDQCAYLRFCDGRGYCDPSTFRCARRTELGEPCIGLPGECAEGLFCSYGLEEGAVCRRQAGEGEACGPELECVEGTECRGSVCALVATGERCDWSDDCPAGTFCDDRTDRCAPLRSEGEECDEYREPCEPELYCGSESYPRLCVPRPGLGQPCDRFTWCGPGATCSDIIGGTCVARAGAGQPCETDSSDPYGSDCREDLFCDRSDYPSSCVARRAPGEPCGSDDECLEGACAWSVGRCVASRQCVVP